MSHFRTYFVSSGKSHPWTNTSVGGNFRRTFRTIGPYEFPQEKVWTNDWSIWISPEIRMDQWRSKFSKSFSLDRYWSIECSSLFVFELSASNLFSSRPTGLQLQGSKKLEESAYWADMKGREILDHAFELAFGYWVRRDLSLVSREELDTSLPSPPHVQQESDIRLFS